MLGTGDAERHLANEENGTFCAESALASRARSTEQRSVDSPSNEQRRLSSFALRLGTPAAKEAAKSFWNTSMLHTSVEKIAYFAKQSLSRDNSPVERERANNAAETSDQQLSFRPVGLVDFSHAEGQHEFLIVDMIGSDQNIRCSRSAPEDEIYRTRNGSTASLFKTTSCPTSAELARMYSNSNLNDSFI